MILSCVRGLGPKPDGDQMLALMENMTGQVVPDTMLLDAGYDSENNHELLLGIEVGRHQPAPLTRRQFLGRATGPWRDDRVDLQVLPQQYGQRW